MDNYNAYCFSVTFTARDFSDGSLGLAWTGSTTGAVGGICEQQATINGNPMSLNSGVVTHVNYGSRTTTRNNQLTFGHETAHALGSNHDTTSACQPGSSGGGNYIMYPRSSTGTLTNNARYSPCTIASMNPFVQNVASGTKNCFQSI
jgi:disintegrin and metalloproteinase domain-containing protein 10